MPARPTSTHALPVEQADLLLCLRLWVAGQQGGFDHRPRIAQIASRLEAAEAVELVDCFMSAFQRSATRSVEIGCIGCRRIGADERILLDVLGLAQERRTFEALLVLRGLLDPEGARTALEAAEGIGCVLARTGRFLPAPDASIGHFGFVTWPVDAVP